MLEAGSSLSPLLRKIHFPPPRESSSLKYKWSEHGSSKAPFRKWKLLVKCFSFFQRDFDFGWRMPFTTRLVTCCAVVFFFSFCELGKIKGWPTYSLPAIRQKRKEREKSVYMRHNTYKRAAEEEKDKLEVETSNWAACWERDRSSAMVRWKIRVGNIWKWAAAWSQVEDRA